MTDQPSEAALRKACEVLGFRYTDDAVDANGVRRSKSFRPKGECADDVSTALLKAVGWRAEWIAKVGGYTSRHGCD